ILRRVVRNVVIGFAAFVLVGNLVILATSLIAQRAADAGPDMPGVAKFEVVDAALWRGAAPSEQGYRSLADAGVAAVVDLRSESEVGIDPTAELARRGVDWVRIPIRDGQTPTADQVRRFLAVIDGADGPVFVHCGAGVGRTGALVAAHLATSGTESGLARLAGNLSVGPPSLEQIVYAASLDGDFSRPNVAVVAASRVLDAPRRIWHNLT
ncbi:MAG TPA: tyrosine-protein phosphatase, partial [Acidimicrobiia bacterium]|nr:tyrosine-protein phosphatase [Acidimicrobiia bacterium]